MKLGIILVLLIALTIITIKYILYRRQVKEICRQIQFVSGEVTNHKIRTDLKDKEVVELAKRINDMCEDQSKKENALIGKDRRLKETLTSVSHDIRTPLTSLKGYFELLMSEEDTDKKLQYAGVMSERMDNLSDLLDELFTYTKLQNQDYKLEMEEWDMTKLVLDTIFSFYEIFKEKGYEPELDIDEKSYKVMCNDLAVKRVISNIVKNALVHGMGDIRLTYGVEDMINEKSIDKKRTHEVSMQETDTRSRWVIFTCENSIPHPENMDITQVFERFYKADKARNEKSTGLGLAIAKEMVEKMDGNIEAKLVGKKFIIEIRFHVI
ncbi:MAG: HAMP domain-containing histidine kinase [Lachnospiraceae bacterium]|nr:HAMP domain-containing histidine kinase [Lachnospiraceae bacterium]MBQ9935228.1 HAMP domain-containing histidine kinase [Lachnospiraceae bacterium]